MKQQLITLPLLLLLAACALPNPTPTPKAQSELIVTRVTATSTPTMGFTATAVPPNTPPPFTPTYRPSATPRPSRTPQNTRPPTLTPTPTPTRFVIAAPSTPAGPPNSYQLKQWTEEDALDMLAAAKDTDWLSGAYYGYDFTGVNAIALLEDEALLRFPDLPNRADLAWQAAFIKRNTYRNIGAYHDDQLPQLIANAVNQEGIPPQNLDTYPPARSFQPTVYPASNLFGRQEPATLLHLINWGWGSPSAEDMLVAISGPGPGAYTVTVVKDWGGETVTGHEILPVADHNGNGLAEIGLIRRYDSGLHISNYCAAHFYLFEWQGDHFTNLAQDVAEFTDSSNTRLCIQPGEYTLSVVEGVPAIIARQHTFTGYDCPHLIRTITYTWHEDHYVWEGEAVDSLPNSITPACAVQWAIAAGANNDQAVSILADALQQAWPAQMDELWGPAASDYFRFQLGLWYDLRGQQELAAQTMQQLRDHPTHATYEMAAQLAAAYLSARQLSGYAACDAVIHTMVEARAAIPSTSTPYNDISPIRQAWGFAHDEWWIGVDNVCDLQTALGMDAAVLSPGSGEQEIMDWLDGMGVSGTAVSPADLNNDGLDDWLILTNLRNSDTLWELRAFVQNETGYTPLYATTLATPNWPTAITYRSFQLPASLGTMHIVAADNDLTAFALVPRNDEWRVRELLPYYSGDTAVTDIRLTQTDTTLSLFIAQNSVENQYDWFPNTATFKQVASNPPTQAEQIGHIEQLIFQQADYQEAIAQIQTLLTQGIVEPQYSFDETYVEPAHVEPRLRYLLGLCYELTGDADNAVAAYWQVWHDFPDNLYTLNARRKLEPIAP